MPALPRRMPALTWLLPGLIAGISPALAADPAPGAAGTSAPDPAPLPWWHPVVARWAADHGLTSYRLEADLTLDDARRILTVTVTGSTAPPAATQDLILRLRDAGPLPPGAPTRIVALVPPREMVPTLPTSTTVEFSSAEEAILSPPLLQPEGPLGDPARDESAMFGGDPARDASAMFGGANAPSGAPADTPGDRDASVLGGDADRTERLLGDALADTEGDVDIGGRLYLRASSNWTEGSSWNSAGFSSPSLLDLYVDARPDDHVRAYADGRLTYDLSVVDGETDLTGAEAEPIRVSLDEMWLKFDLGNRLFVTAGKQQLRWGTGRFWNPTDFLNPEARDPLAVFDARLGVPLLKLHLPIEPLAANLYAVADFNQVDSAEQVGGALRAEIAAGPGEYALSVAAREDRPLRLGADASMAVWAFDLRLEAALLHNLQTPYYEGEFDIETFTFPEATDRSDAWIPQVVAGFEIPIRYSDEDSLSLGGEYFFNGAGYEDATLYPYLLFQGEYKPLYFGTHYAAGYLFLSGPGAWNDTSFILSTVANLSDMSAVTRLDVRSQLRTWISVDAAVSYYAGDQGEFHYGLTIPAIPGVIDAEITVLAQQWSFSAGA